MIEAIPDTLESEYSVLVLEEDQYRGPAGFDGVVVAVGREIRFNPDHLNTYCNKGWEPVHRDLLLVCAAVELCDRSVARRASGWCRRFNLTLPVLEAEIWRRPEVSSSLREALRQVTGDFWNINFIEAQGDSAPASQQLPLHFHKPRLAIPYSSGLDSYCAGLLFDPDEKEVRVRVGGRNTRRKRYEGDAFTYLPFSVDPPSTRETSVKSRGFKFASAAAIAAHLSGLQDIIVPESGQGALGPAMVPLHNSCADYRNHPTFFRKMEGFILALLGHRVRYEQPRLWFTKGETILEVLTTRNVDSKMFASTRSCWQQQRWNTVVDGKRRQCGICSACLLRRMSFHTAGVQEPEDTYAVTKLSASTYRQALPEADDFRESRGLVEYACVAARQIQQFANLATASAEHLRTQAYTIALATGESASATEGKLRRLLEQHSQEWRSFLATFGPNSFLTRWLEGG